MENYTKENNAKMREQMKEDSTSAIFCGIKTTDLGGGQIKAEVNSGIFGTKEELVRMLLKVMDSDKTFEAVIKGAAELHKKPEAFQELILMMLFR